MKFFPFFLLLVPLAVQASPATDSDPSIPGQIAAGAQASAPAGPFLSPPAGGEEGVVVNSSDLVPPVSYAAGAHPPADPSAGAPDPAPSENATINLIRLMVKRGLISKDDAVDLIAQSRKEAVAAQAAGTKPEAPQATGPDGILVPPSTTSSPDGDSVNVAYVPEVVKNQIRDEVKADVLKQAQDEHWGGNESDIPEWVHRFRVTGDIRTRYQGDFFPDDNVTGQQVNFNAINTGTPLNINASPLLPPTYNEDRERDRIRLRARIGAEIDLLQGFTAGIRLGTGSDDQPVSENQTLGGVNSSTENQGGDFSKYQIWLDRAFIRYELGGTPQEDLTVSVGRFDNPFFGTSMIWADDLAFDGFAVSGKYEVAPGVTPFATAGAFPVYNTDLNFGTSSTPNGQGYSSEDKWLYAAQIGTNWKINKDFNFKIAAAYYDFNDIQGKVSDPIDQDVFTSVGSGYQGNTDDSRPSFAQHGNTYIALRNVVPGVLPTATSPDFQYYGLATAFREVAITGQLDFSGFDPFHMMLVGEFVDNIAFDRNAILDNGPANDPGPQNNNNGTDYAGGSRGYDLRFTVGHPALQKLWDWNVNLTYRYVESDATVDGFTDADFGDPLTGTNLKGYILGANLALNSHVWTSLRWLSGDSISGPTYKSDVIQFDLNAKF